MSLPNEVNPQHLGSTGYNLTNSLRFRSDANAYMNRTPASTTNLKTWTWSAWIKRGNSFGRYHDLFYVPNGATASHHVYFYDFNAIGFEFYNVTYDYYVASTAVQRDPAAWYHVVAVWDTTQATASNRMRLYVNNVLINNIGSTSYPTQNFDGYVNNSSYTKYIGRNTNISTAYYDGYMAEINFIDGQGLTPSSFGETDSVTGVWKPKKYTGSYGTNGYYLPFTNTTSTTTLGYDFSGNGNNFTTNNFSLTAGPTYDSFSDVPTMSATASNYCTLNPISNQGNGTISNGNLYYAASSWKTSAGTQYLSSGKWYYELTIATYASSSMYGVVGSSFTDWATYLGHSAVGWGWQYTGAGSGAWNNNTTGPGDASNGALNDVYMCAFDVDAGKIWWGKNGTWFNSGNPAAGTNAAYSNLTGTLTPAVSSSGSSDVCSMNFGQKAFSYTPPSGFKAINTYNLPEPTIVKPNKQFDVSTYTGTGAIQDINNSSGTMYADFIWIKSRSATTSHILADKLSGIQNFMNSDNTAVQQNDARVIRSTSTGSFQLGTDAGASGSNQNGATYVAWQWQAGQNANTTNTSGSITSQVNANPTAGFSIVNYTGTGSAATVGHGLGAVPDLIIIKRKDVGTGNWIVYSSLFGSSSYMLMNTNDGSQAAGGLFNSTNATSSVFSIGTPTDLNASGSSYVAYCWTAIRGYSAFGSYTGNGSADGPFVNTGFRPKFIMIKRTDSSAGRWDITDTSRNTYNYMTQWLYANFNYAEDNAGELYDHLSNGFKLRNTGSGTNGSGGTFMYMAFAENPFKYALAR